MQKKENKMEVKKVNPAVKKMKQGMSYSRKEKTIILNVFKYFRLEYPEKCVTELVRRTSKATGCSEKSIFQFRKEEASAEGFKEPSKTKTRKNININSRDIKYDNTVREAIRKIIYDLKYHNVVPSLNTILKQVNTNSNLPNFSLMTLRRLLFDMGFYYEKNGNKSILVEKNGINKEEKSTKENSVMVSQNVIESQKVNVQQPIVQNNVPPPPPPPTIQHYNHQGAFMVPMHINHDNNSHMMGHLHPNHNRNMMMNFNKPAHPTPHLVQSPWMHPQMQPALVISTE